MMRRRFRRRNKAAWIWADRFTFSVTDGASPSFNAHEILPAGRVKFLCDSAKRSHISPKAFLLWLDFAWHTNHSGSVGLPDVDMYAIRSTEDENATVGFAMDPFVQPQVPALINSWDVSPSDGLDSFLWCHHIKGSGPPNGVTNATPATGLLFNQYSAIASDGTTVVRMCRTFRVTQEWQPDVVIKTRRRLAPNNIVMLGMRTPGTNTGVVAQLDVNVRVVG